eukprot:SAG11_NODE_2622_length_3167_cov_3.968057_3_plen_328_part_00
MNLQMFPPHQKYMTVDMGPAMAADGQEISAANPRYVLCNCMPFGYQASPYYFVKMLRVVQARLNQAGVVCQMWLDDGIVLADTEAISLQHREILVRVLAEFGLKRQETKGEWTPCQDVTHLGVGVNTAAGVFYVTRERKQQIRAQARRIICSAKRHKRWVGARWLAEFAGLAMSTHDAVAQCAYRLRALFDVLRGAEVWRRGYGIQVKLTGAALGALQWWVDKMNPGGDSTPGQIGLRPAVEQNSTEAESLGTAQKADMPCKPIWRAPVTEVITTDASGEGPADAPGGGWGATLGAQPLHLAPPDSDNGVGIRGIWAPADQDLSSKQ